MRKFIGRVGRFLLEIEARMNGRALRRFEVEVTRRTRTILGKQRRIDWME
ncbi:MAG: hypothetical protein K9N62_03850 [Verrucomicrobia bacterium]|nr:hypothetical protein [Verrucomicrobiota bacterium]